MNQELYPSSRLALSIPSNQMLVTYAEIKSTELMSGATYRWEYTLQPLRMEDDIEANSFEDFADEVKGVNIREFKNTGTVVNGIGVSTLPSGFDFGPVAGVVACWGGCRFPLNNTDENVQTVWMFSSDNPVSGTCT